MCTRIILTLLLLFSASAAYSQGMIVVTDSAGANALVERHIYFNKEHGELPGFRVQILSSSSLSDVKTAKAAFLQRFPDYKANIVYEAPNYKLRIGNYTNRFDANMFMQEFLIFYPNAFIVKDMIHIAE